MRIDHQETATMDSGHRDESSGVAERPWRLLTRLARTIARLGRRQLTIRQVAVCDLEPRLLHDIGMEPDRVRRLCHLQESAAWRR